MHKRETTAILLLKIAVLGTAIVIAWYLAFFQQPDIQTIPDDVEAHRPVPNFAEIDDVKEKKQAFFAYLRPEVEAQNAHILAQRHYLMTMLRHAKATSDLTRRERKMYNWLLNEYRVDKDLPFADQAKALLLKVDILPVELVLVQSANESAWGTSRFAREGYNFFGLWCYQKGCGFVPSRRNKGAEHEVAKFSDLATATYTYMRNINRHNAYSDLRAIRASLRQHQKPISGEALADGLLNYSERGAAYVEELQSMIRFNKEYLTE